MASNHTNSNPLYPRPPKLRQSCDACTAAKVRCSKSRPRCDRCISTAQSCIYGISRKHGKPPKNRGLRNDTQQQASGTAPYPLTAFPESTPQHVPALGLTSVMQTWSSVPPPTPHDCTALAHRTLATLNCHTHPSTLPAALPPLDRILTTAAAAVSTIQSLLSCEQCTRDPHLGVLYASLIIRVLGWYRLAAGLGESEPGDGRWEHEVSTMGIAHGDVGEVAGGSIMVGGFEVRKEEREGVRDRLVAGAVRRLGGCMEKWRAVFGEGVGGMGEWLGGEVGRTMEELEGRG